MRYLSLSLLLILGCRAPEEPPADLDADGSVAGVDCNDNDPNAFPGATETCNGVDDDCNGIIDNDPTDATPWFADVDGDGFGSSSVTEEACGQPAGFVADATDCDDNDEAFHPGAVEDDCSDPADYNCDGSTGFADLDEDGFAACQECDDTVASVNPDADEACDTLDNDCDGLVDEPGSDGQSTWYADADGDGTGNPLDTKMACDQPEGYVGNGTDCNDSSDASYPGGVEICDGVDNDCNGTTDAADATDAPIWYVDTDADGHGSASVTQRACSQPLGFVASSDDCDDSSATANPGGTEVCDETDNNCDGVTDEGFDSDGDGYYVCVDDCDDNEISVNPGASEDCDGMDNDCDGAVDEPGALNELSFYADGDSDGFGNPAVEVRGCAAPVGFVSDDTDCDDASSAVNPGETESCNTVDDNCDDAIDEGFDTDGDGYVACVDDCDDNDAALNPDTSWYLDFDGDGHGATTFTFTGCSAPNGYVLASDDCDDQDASYSPSAALGCDGEDYDCDGNVDNDVDEDGYSDIACGGTDCLDTDASVLPEIGGGCALGTDCLDIVSSGLDAGDGLYSIDPDGFLTGTAPYDVYCDMTTDGGGWQLAMNIHTSDGHLSGWGDDYWYADAQYNTLDNALIEDYRDQATFHQAADELMITNHTLGAINAWKKWEFLTAGSSLQGLFNSTYRDLVTSPVVDSADIDSPLVVDCPIMRYDGALYFNYYYSNNGVRIAPAGQYLAGENENSDNTYGLGVDYATSQGNVYTSTSQSNYSGDASVYNRVTSCQGTDNEANCTVANNVSYQYGIYVR